MTGPGYIRIPIKRHYLHFNCTDGVIDVQELQLEGKKRMKVEEFLRGFRFE
jgi:methionyl-tRNA formyltransferase